MVAATKYKPEFCEIAKNTLARGDSLASVCAELDITRTTLYEWRDSNADFSDAIEKGLQKSQHVWEEIGRNGIVGNYEKFSGTPWMFMMKNRFRADYTEDKQEISSLESVVDKLIDKLVD